MAVLIVLYALLLITVHTDKVQRWMGEKAAAVLSRRIGSRVSIERAKLGLFNRVDLEGVKLSDRKDETLLCADALSAKIAWRQLLEGKVRLRSVFIMDGDIRLYKARPDSAGNWQFVIDAFKSKKEEPSAPLDLAIGSIIIRRTRLSYDERYKPEGDGRINPSHLAVTDLDASISLRRLTDNDLGLRIRSLSLNEKSGLDVRKMTGQITANKQLLQIRNFDLALPSSHLHLDSLALHYKTGGNTSFLNRLSSDLSLKNAEIATRDFAFLLPQLRQTSYKFNLSTSAAWRPEHLRVEELSLREEGGGIELLGRAAIDFKGNSMESLSADAGHVFVRNTFAQAVARLFSAKPLPKEIAALGDVAATGSLSITKSQGTNAFKGKVSTGVGTIDGDVKWRGKQIEGIVQAAELSPDKLFPGKELPTAITAKIAGKADLTNAASPAFEGKIDLQQATYHGYTYRGINAEGAYGNHNINVDIASSDPDLNMKGSLKAHIEGKKLSDVELTADIRRLVLGRVGVKGNYARTTLEGSFQGRVPSASQFAPNGEIRIQDFRLGVTDKPVALNGIHLKAMPSARGVRIDAVTDFAAVHIDGSANMNALKRCVRALAERALNGNAPQTRTTGQEEEWIVNADIHDDAVIRQFVKMPLHLAAPLSIKGNLRADGRHSALSVQTDSMEIGGAMLYSLTAYAEADAENMHAIVQGQKQIGKNLARFALDLNTQDAGLRSTLKWDAGTNLFVGGEVNLTTNFDTENSKIRSFHTSVEPSRLSIDDTNWDITGGEIYYNPGKLEVRGFNVQHDDGALNIDGQISQNEGDSIACTLNNVAVEYIMSLVNFHSVDFAGLATGKATIKLQDKQPHIATALHIPNFKINNEEMGGLNLRGSFDMTDKQINLDGLIANIDSGETAVKGYINLSRKDLNLDIDGEHTNLGFLKRYVSGIFRNFKGDASGHCRLFGPLKKLDLEGTERGNASAEIIATGAAYNIKNGTVDITPGDFAFKNFAITDYRGGRGTISGHLLHDNLKNIRYNFDGTVSNLLVYNQEKSVSLPFYSTAYGTGSVHLEGLPGSFEADINLRPDKGTTLTYIVNTPETFGENAFVTFHDRNTKATANTSEKTETTSAKNSTSTTDIRLNMLIDANPDATINIIMDEKTGDNIALQGTGNIRANFYNKGRFNLYGTYTIDDGIYKMTVSDIIRKDFRLTKGGTLNFAGNPYQGDLDMQAVYTVNSASLSDLNLTGNFNQNSVKVNCLLNFSGKVLNPIVSFDLDLPSLGEDEKQMVRNLISTEEDMNMQILYLLGFGRFYSYNYAAAGTSTTAAEQSAAAMKSFLSSTLSSQLNNIISNAMGSQKWTLGANVSTGSLGTNEMEVDGILSGRLFNNRLLVNGNFGYRDNSVYNNNFIGDFDVQYLLTPGGSVSLKAYSETNDRYFTKSSLTTQGVGILLRRDFSGIKELFTRKKSKARKVRTKKKK